jgi:hypothetical protein
MARLLHWGPAAARPSTQIPLNRNPREVDPSAMSPMPA